MKQHVASLTRHFILIVACLLMLGPIAYMVLASFKTIPDFFDRP